MLISLVSQFLIIIKIPVIMKKLILILVAACVFQNVFAQGSSLPLNRYYFITGINSNSFTRGEMGNISAIKSFVSYHGGFLATVSLSRSVGFQPGLVFVSKGAKTELYQNEEVRSDNFYKLKTNPLYVELPINVLYQKQLISTIAVFAGAGPYMAVAVAGNNKGERRINGNSSTISQGIKFSDHFLGEELYRPVANMERFDYGFNIVAGAELRGFILRVNYGFGLADVTTDVNSNVKNRLFSLSVGFKL